MIATWMLYSLLVAIALAAVATLVEGIARAQARPARFVWLGAIGLSALLTAWAARPVANEAPVIVPAIDPAIEVSPYPVSQAVAAGPARSLETTSAAHRQSMVEAFATGEAVSLLAARSWAASVLSSIRSLGSGLDRPLLWLWATMTACAWLLLFGSVMRLRGRRSRWGLSSVDGQAVRVADGVGPAVIGFLTGEIVVPRWLLALDPTRQRLVIEHERQHVEARDPLLMLVALVMAALLPWNPAVWLMVRRLRRATELDCDRRVLRALPVPDVYAALLVDMGGGLGARTLIGAGLVGSSFDLERRVTEILSVGRRLGRRALGVRAAAAAALLVAACAAPRPAVDIAPSQVADQEPETGAAAVEDATSVHGETAVGTVASVVTTGAGRSDVARSGTAVTGAGRSDVARSGTAVTGAGRSDATGSTVVVSGAGRTVGADTAHARVEALGSSTARRVEAQGAVTGRVTDADTGEPIGGAQVAVVGTRIGGVTAENGRFLIAGVPEGTHTVRAQFIGFVDAQATRVQVTDGQATTQDFALERQVLSLDRVVVTRGMRPAPAAGITIGTPPNTRTIDSDTIALLVARLHPEALRQPSVPDTILVALAFDEQSGVLTHDAAVPWHPESPTNVALVLESLFPELNPDAWRRRVLTMDNADSGNAPRRRTVITVYGIYAPR